MSARRQKLNMPTTHSPQGFNNLGGGTKGCPDWFKQQTPSPNSGEWILYSFSEGEGRDEGFTRQRTADPSPNLSQGEETTTPSPRWVVPERQEGVQQDINRTTTRICRTHYVRQQQLPPPKRGITKRTREEVVCLA